VDPGELLWKASELLVVPQRKGMRALLRVSIKGLEGDTPFFAQSQNISISGMLLETDHVLRLGERMTCAFNIGHSEITVSCMVKRIEEAMSVRHRYGVKFMDCDTKSLVIIEHFVKTQPKQQQTVMNERCMPVCFLPVSHDNYAGGIVGRTVRFS
jgi:hypothetical protein